MRLLTRSLFALLLVLVTGGRALATINDPVLYYTMDNSSISGTTVTDSGSGGNNGTLVGSPTTGATGKIGQAVTFNGTSQYISSASPLNGLTDLTIAFWAYRTGTTNGMWGQGDGTTSSFMETGGAMGGTGRLVFRGTTIQSMNFTNPLVANTWTHVCIVRTTSNITIYQNGASYASASLAGAAITAAATNGLNIGRVPSGSSAAVSYFTGSIDDFRIYSRALSPSEVTDLNNYTGGSSGPIFRRNLNMRSGSRSPLSLAPVQPFPFRLPATRYTFPVAAPRSPRDILTAFFRRIAS